MGDVFTLTLLWSYCLYNQFQRYHKHLWPMCQLKLLKWSPTPSPLSYCLLLSPWIYWHFFLILWHYYWQNDNHCPIATPDDVSLCICNHQHCQVRSVNFWNGLIFQLYELRSKSLVLLMVIFHVVEVRLKHLHSFPDHESTPPRKFIEHERGECVPKM